MPGQSLAEGTIFAKRYRVLRVVAHGGMGSVYEVVHIETERRRALKVMHPEMLQSQDLRERFRREARVTARIDSEFIVEVFDAGVDEGTEMPFLVMELLRGEELSKRLARLGPIPSAEVVTYLRQVGIALDKAHRAAIVHRDLKPQNLFLTFRDDGSARIKILDFGIAKVVAESETSSAVTRSLGTPMYMAPEQFQTGGRVSAAADTYALGMIAYTLLAGRPYWHEELKQASNVIAFVLTTLQGQKEPASVRAARRNVRLPTTFDVWFAKATAADPAQRFASAGESIMALADALGMTADATGRVMALPDLGPPAQPSTSSVGLAVPRPAPPPLQPTPTGPGAALPTPTGPGAALPTPTGPGAALSTPTEPGAALPTPTEPGAVLPTPTAPGAVLPTPSGLDPSLPTPSSFDPYLPTPSGLDPSLPTPSGLDPYLPTPSGLDPSLPTPSSFEPSLSSIPHPVAMPLAVSTAIDASITRFALPKEKPPWAAIAVGAGLLGLVAAGIVLVSGGSGSSPGASASGASADPGDAASAADLAPTPPTSAARGGVQPESTTPESTSASPQATSTATSTAKAKADHATGTSTSKPGKGSGHGPTGQPGVPKPVYGRD